MQTEINVQNDKITSLAMSWEFDAMTSAYMLADEDISPSNRAEVLDKVAQEVIENMLASHYFTYFYQLDEPIRYKKVTQGALSQKGAKLTLDFQLELVKPVQVNAPDLNLMIFDPSYFVDMSWDNRHSLEFSQNYQGACQIKLVQPEPTAEQLAYAMSLSVDADPDNELGKLFTQKAFISCNEKGE